MRPLSAARQRGTSLIEFLVVTAILATTIAMGTAGLTSMLRRRDLRFSAEHVRQVLQIANAEGQAKGAYRGLLFHERAGKWFYTVYEDGNGNGVLIADIRAAIDRRVDGPRSLLPPGSFSTIGFPQGGIPDPDTGQPIPPGEPVRFGVSRLCSFSAYSTCTPGSLYLTDGDNAAVVRCSGAGGTIRVLRYGFEGARWVE